MTSIFPISYFGSISYYKEIVKAKNPIFEQWETFPRSSLRNRCSILSPNGILDLTIPLSKPFGSKTITKDVNIDFTNDWKKKHWRTIVSSYSSSPFFDYYGVEIEELINFESKSLLEFTLNIHNRICCWLDLNSEFSISADYEFIVENDYRLFSDNSNFENNYKYQQVFASKENFVPNLSILDAILNLGPMARNLLI